MPIDVILASRSPSRQDTLVRAGIKPTVLPVEVDEDTILQKFHQAPFTTRVEALATAKARRCFWDLVTGVEGERMLSIDLLDHGNVVDSDAIAAYDFDVPLPDRCTTSREVIIIGCDSMFIFNGCLVGKPHRPQTAIERISAMANKSGQLLTGHHVIYITPDGEVLESTQTSSATVHVGDLSQAEIEAYVASGEPLEVAGSFTLEGLGGAFIEYVEGDYHGVIGLSLPLLRIMLRDLGVFWPDLWSEEAKHYGGGAQYVYR